MRDIVKRLRDAAECDVGFGPLLREAAEAADEIERLRKEVAELRKSTGHSWKAVADEMPPIGKDYLVYMPGVYHTKIDTQSCCNDGRQRPTWPDGWNKGQRFEITHWMPLPKPPAVEGES